MKKILLSLGSNIGNKKENLENVISYIQEKFSIIAISDIFETSPVDLLQQADFFNLCLLAETTMSLEESFLFLQEIEEKMGRVPCSKRGPKGPRIIDIDIIFYNRQSTLTTVDGKTLIVPHPSYSKRLFVLAPMRDIELQTQTEFRHPITRQSVRRYIEQLKQTEQHGDDIQKVQKLSSKIKITRPRQSAMIF